MLSVIASFVAALCGVVAALSLGRSAIPPMRTFAMVAMLGVVGLHILPEAILGTGWAGLMLFIVAAMVPSWLERLAAQRAPENGGRPMGLVLAQWGLLLHAFGDGLIMGMYEQAHSGHDHEQVIFALAAHKLPVVAYIFLRTRRHEGTAKAYMAAASLLGATLLGIAVVALAPSAAFQEITPWINAAVAGLIMHDLAHPEHEDIERTRGLAIADVLALVLAVAIMAMLTDETPAQGAITLDFLSHLGMLAPGLLMAGALAYMPKPADRRSAQIALMSLPMVGLWHALALALFLPPMAPNAINAGCGDEDANPDTKVASWVSWGVMGSLFATLLHLTGLDPTAVHGAPLEPTELSTAWALLAVGLWLVEIRVPLPGWLPLAAVSASVLPPWGAAALLGGSLALHSLPVPWTSGVHHPETPTSYLPRLLWLPALVAALALLPVAMPAIPFEITLGLSVVVGLWCAWRIWNGGLDALLTPIADHHHIHHVQDQHDHDHSHHHH